MPRDPQDPILQTDAHDEPDEQTPEGEPASRVIAPIRDEPDHLVFRFELGPAILAQLLEKLSRVAAVPIREAEDAKYPGFYQLLLHDQPKYIGKTSRPISVRLREHIGKLRGRTGISLAEVRCRYAFVEDPSLVDVAEGALIDFFSRRGMADWNLSGFGSKVPGYGRDRTAASAWSRQYPPDLTHSVLAGTSEPLVLSDLVAVIGSQSPITFTIPKEYKAKFKAAHVARHGITPQTLPFIQWVDLVKGLLAPGWKLIQQPVGWYIVPNTT
ncbi:MULTISPECIES: Eco29kI family restriction endonuclease [unclassified Corallococcus]|uniref:Eco29kI family restriction endonuclease n=1 Tax=unclassified Corallococcus TaxID=2685029 RepID=UPI001A8ED8B9|nr:MULTISPECIES: Eco29kI family restriction endonuclease [unclassified Corallococcus]MBN9680926.1 Eco29kI family restriction endonuclease [Corallococcus sp. NCSPR001]WAS87476.1 Eco29kI family restriction endonuclease [Corallococcus sp. NCRR]